MIEVSADNPAREKGGYHDNDESESIGSSGHNQGESIEVPAVGMTGQGRQSKAKAKADGNGQQGENGLFAQ